LHPEHMHLNRGNHEDIMVNEAYGFTQEVEKKYKGSGMMDRFGSLFASIPLCAIIGKELGEKAIFVVHGGLMKDQKAGIDAIQKIPRKKYKTVCTDGRRTPKELLMMQELMWSDPTEDGRDGIYPSFRGTGIEFGPDAVTTFLRLVKCSTLIRSHEAIEVGIELSTHGCGPLDRLPKQIRLYTVFSASNYSDGCNLAAVLHWTSLKDPEIYQFETKKAPSHSKVARRNRVKISELLCRRHHRLLRAFEALDEAKTGKVNPVQWADVMQNTLRLKLDWAAMQSQLAPEGPDGSVSYVDFLAKYSMQQLGKKQVPNELRATVSALYEHYPLLKAAFNVWDTNHDGKVDKKEFTKGVSVLNDHIKEQDPESVELLDSEVLFNLLDIDGGGSIELDEFCECFRLLATGH